MEEREERGRREGGEREERGRREGRTEGRTEGGEREERGKGEREEREGREGEGKERGKGERKGGKGRRGKEGKGRRGMGCKVGGKIHHSPKEVRVYSERTKKVCPITEGLQGKCMCSGSQTLEEFLQEGGVSSITPLF